MRRRTRTSRASTSETPARPLARDDAGDLGRPGRRSAAAMSDHASIRYRTSVPSGWPRDRAAPRLDVAPGERVPRRRRRAPAPSPSPRVGDAPRRPPGPTVGGRRRRSPGPRRRPARRVTPTRDRLAGVGVGGSRSWPWWTPTRSQPGSGRGGGRRSRACRRRSRPRRRRGLDRRGLLEPRVVIGRSAVAVQIATPAARRKRQLAASTGRRGQRARGTRCRRGSRPAATAQRSRRPRARVRGR